MRSSRTTCSPRSLSFTTLGKRTQTTLTGDVADQEELQGVLNHLSMMGITIIDVITIPDQDAG